MPDFWDYYGAGQSVEADQKAEAERAQKQGRDAERARKQANRQEAEKYAAITGGVVDAIGNRAGKAIGSAVSWLTTCGIIALLILGAVAVVVVMIATGGR